ncbi:Dabb family protein [Fodinicola feengrottensis]|uniref:Dabb family protein n=1 Tax=Fodinicola feengrottensis TaxID=435914 RepID=UPI0036F3874C
MRDGNADFAVVAVLADEEGVRAYLDHPEHVRVVETRVKPIVATRSAVQMAIAD